ncbi:MAG: transketolase C-terminal domain-containing protein, partial [Hyphomicrobium sp.]|nr:transketolase C-terminal domain-containing protein [Hyphomicrobium sp.]
KEPDPVIIFEHATLYPQEGESEDGTAMEIGRAALRRRGKDVSLITYGGALGKTERAAAKLAELGIYAEVIDLRCLRPLDTETILASVAHTHRAVIIEEAWKTCGFAAEVSARIMEGAFDALDAPVARVCGAEVPMPYAQALEQAALPQPETIVKAVQGLF